MSAEIIPFERSAPGDAQRTAEAAWERYDVAARQLQRLYQDQNSTKQERFEASMEAVRLHRLFTRAMERL